MTVEGNPTDSGEGHEPPSAEGLPEGSTQAGEEGRHETASVEDYPERVEDTRPVEQQQAEEEGKTPNDEHNNHEGRYDINKATTVAHAIQRSGFIDDDRYTNPYLSDRDRRKLSHDYPRYNTDHVMNGSDIDDMSEQNQELNAKIFGIENEIERLVLALENVGDLYGKSTVLVDMGAHRYIDSESHIENRLEEIRDSLLHAKNRLHKLCQEFEKGKQSSDRIFAGFYDLNPERFNNMSIPEFVGRAGEYLRRISDIKVLESDVEDYDRAIHELDDAVKNESEDIKVRVALNNTYLTTAFGRLDYDSYDSFDLPPTYEEAIEAMSERAEGCKAEGDDKQAEALQEMVSLAGPFGDNLSTHDKLMAIRGLVAGYWKPRSETYLVKSRAELEEYKAKFAPTQPSSETNET